MSAWIDWLRLDGYGSYVWGSVLMCALVIALELWWLRQRHRAVLAAVANEPAASPTPVRVPTVTAAGRPWDGHHP